MKHFPKPPRRPVVRSWIEPLESRIAPASFDLTPFAGQGPFTLEVDPNDAHVHIVTAGVGEIFDLTDLGPNDNLSVTGGGALDSFNIASSAGGNVSLSGTLSVNIPGPINVNGPVGTGVDLSLTSTGAGISYSATILLGASAAHFTAARNIVLNPNSALTADSGDIVMRANIGPGQNGNFIGIRLDSASITTTGAGAIDLAGSGGNNAGNNVGIALANGAGIFSTSALANAGAITLMGTAGQGSGPDNHGVFIAGAGSIVTTVRGLISITGTGNGIGSSNNIGVLLGNGAQVTTSGTSAPAGMIMITGQGGGGGSANHGIFLDGSGADPKVMTATGTIMLQGTGDPLGVGPDSQGIAITQGGQVLAGGVGGRLDLTGTAGNGAGGLRGVVIDGAGSLVGAMGGPVSVTGSGGAGGAVGGNNGVFINGGGKISGQGTATGTVSVTGNAGGGPGSEGIAITGAGSGVESLGGSGLSLLADSINIDPAASVNAAAGGAAKLAPKTPGTGIDLGGADGPGKLGLSAGELGAIAGSPIIVGDANSGAINFSTALILNRSLTLTTPATVSGAATLTLTGTANLTVNAFAGVDLSGPVSIAGNATFSTGAANAIGVANAANNFASVQVTGGGSASFRDDGGFALGTVNLDTLLTVESAGTITQSGAFSGNAGLTKLGTGTLILAAANTYAGTTTINAGTLQVGDASNGGTDGSLGSGPVTDDSALVFDIGGTLTVTNAISGLGTVTKSGAGTVTFGAVNGYNGTTVVNAGTLLVNGTLTNSSPITVNAGGTLGGNGTIDRNIVNNGAILLGSGTLTVNGTFTQNGGATTLAGGSISTPGTLDFNGGVLAGTGTITGDVNNSGATVRPGGTGAAGTLTITGAYTHGPGATLDAEIGGLAAGQFDVLAIGGAATLGNTLNLSYLPGFTPASGSQFRIVTSGNNPGAFATITGAASGITQLPDATGLVLQATSLTYIWDAGAGPDTSWFNPLNWNLDAGVPGAIDQAILNVNVTITLPADASVSSFAQSAGTISGGGMLTVRNSYDWTAGTMAGGGTTAIASGGTLAISSGALHRLAGRTIENSGAITWSGKGLLSADTAVNVIDNLAGSTFDAENDGGSEQIGGGTLAINILPGATFTRSGAATTTSLGADTIFNNDGTVTIASGTLRVPGGTSGGAFALGSGALLDFAGSNTQTLTATSSVAGTGRVSVSAGTTTVAGGYMVLGTTITGGTLQFDSAGPGLDGSFTLAGGALFYNVSGTVNPDLAITHSSTIGVGTGQVVTLASVVSGAVEGPGGTLGALTKSGAGTLILGNPLNDFGQAKVKIIDGTLQAATDGALGDAGNDIEINNATFAASSGFVSARHFKNTGGTATIDAQAPTLTLINKAIVPADLTATIPANLAFAIAYADTTPAPDGTITVGDTTVSLAGGGTLVVHKSSPTTIDTIELTGTSSTTKLVIKGPKTGTTTINRIVIDDADPGITASIGSIVLGTNVRLGDGVHDSVPDLYVEGKATKLQLYDIESYGIIRLGESLPHGDTADKKTASSKTNAANLTIHEMLGPGVLLDLTPSDLPPDGEGELVGGGGLGKVVVDKWDFPGAIRTTQSMKSFRLNTGDCLVVFQLDKYHVGSDTEANCGSMTIPEGAWGSSGSEIEGGCGSFNANEFLAGATLTCGSMGKFGLDAGAFAGLLTLTDPDAPGIPTFTVNGDFSGTVDSESPLRKIKVKGDFTGELEAPFIGSISAYSFIGTNTPGEYNTITATDGALGTLTATAGVVKNFSIVTDLAFKGFNIKLAKLTTDTVGIDNVHIQAASIGNILVSLTADKGASDIDLIGIRDSSFVTTGHGTTKTDKGSIGNVTVTLTGASGTATGKSAIGIQSSSFDALVLQDEFGSHDESLVNSLGKIAVKVAGHDGATLGLENVDFSANAFGAISIVASKGKSGTATAHAVETASFTAIASDLALAGGVGAVVFDGDATEAQVQGLTLAADGKVAGVAIKAKNKSLGTLDSSAILAGQALDMTGSADPQALARAALGAVNTTGSILDSILVAGGSIAAVSIGKDLTGSLILAGAKLGDDAALGGAGAAADDFQRTAAIAAITVKGSFGSTSIAAGVKPGNGVFGDAGDTAATNLAGTSAIGAVSIGSVVTGGSAGTAVLSSHSFAIEAGSIKSVKIGTGPALADFSTARFIDSANPSGDDAADVVVRLL